MAIVSSKSELQEAVRKKEQNITVTGSIAKKLKPLAKTNKLNKSNIPTTQAALVGYWHSCSNNINCYGRACSYNSNS